MSSYPTYKTNSVIVAAIFPEVADALLAIRKMEGYDSSPEKPILPYRYSVTGKFVSSDLIKSKKSTGRKHQYIIRTTPSEQRPADLRVHWNNMMKKHGFSLRMRDCRHFVTKKCKDIGLTGVDRDVASRLTGHDPDPGANMQDWYSAKSIEEIIDQQKMRLPDGPLGQLYADVQITSDIPSELTGYWQKYLKGEIDTFEMVRRVEALKNDILLNTSRIET
jgi:hypothetical protein